MNIVVFGMFVTVVVSILVIVASIAGSEQVDRHIDNMVRQLKDKREDRA